MDQDTRLSMAARDQAAWREQLEGDLNPSQREFACSRARSILGLAGPGSGKTRALTYRAAGLLVEGVPPGRLLLVTFTNKAAEEMKSRIQFLLGVLPSGLWAGTFHATGARALRMHAERLGRTSRFSILDADDSRQMVSACFTDLGLTVDPGDKRVLITSGLLARLISSARNAQKPLADIMERDYPQLDHLIAMACRVEESYRRRKREADAFDFDDLLCGWLEILREDENLTARWRRRFDHILVDEYQDTNAIQSDLVEMLAPGGSVAVVGDDAQSIYAFRQADLRNILTFQDRFTDCQVVRLEENYRSTPEILGMANAIIGQNREQLPKTLVAMRPSGERPWLVQARDPSQEAVFICGQIWRLLEEGVPPGEIAVLYRSSYLSQRLEMELARQGIRYTTIGGPRFLDRAHVRDVLAFLRVINNPRDEVSWQRIATMQEGVGPATFKQVWALIVESQEPLREVLSGQISPSRGKRGWRGLAGQLEELAGLQEASRPVGDLIGSLLEGTYGKYLESSYADALDRRRSLEQLGAMASEYEDLGEFLELVTLDDSLALGQGGRRKESGGVVTLSTCHSAKGKEWDTVFISSLAEGIFPDARAIDNLEEERRLFYVAVTRARNRLYLSFCQYDNRPWTGDMGLEPSRFLMELPRDSYSPHYLLADGEPVLYEFDG